MKRLALATVGFFLLLAIFGPWLAPYSASQTFESAYRLPPLGFEGADARFVLGTDDVGRDQVSRLIEGARLSLFAGLAVTLISMSLGVLIGAIAGWSGGWIESVILRLMDTLMALPSILLAIVVVTILGPSLTNAVLAAAVTSIPGVVRVVRAAIAIEKTKSYALSSRLFGAGSLRTVVLDLLPNCMAPILVQLTLGFGDGVLNVAALGFLGLGARPPAAEWGTMLADAKGFIESAPFLVVLPGLCILVVILSVNVLGDSLRDRLDPKLRKL